jgi:hypothetical protein
MKIVSRFRRFNCLALTCGLIISPSAISQTIVDGSDGRLSKRQIITVMNFSAKSFKNPSEMNYRGLYVSKGKFICGQSRYINLLGQDEGFQPFYIDIVKEDGLRSSKYRDKTANQYFLDIILENCSH